MEGFGKGLADMLGCMFLIGLLLIAIIVIVTTASIIGWPKVLSWWPYGVAAVVGGVIWEIVRGTVND